MYEWLSRRQMVVTSLTTIWLSTLIVQRRLLRSFPGRDSDVSAPGAGNQQQQQRHHRRDNYLVVMSLLRAAQLFNTSDIFKFFSSDKSFWTL